MRVYVVENETETGERNVLGVFVEKDEALRKRGEYAAENQWEKCWIQEFDTENWQYETEEKYRMIHQTRIHKISKITSHVILFSKEEFVPVEEDGDWYVVRSEDTSFDKEEGLRRNLEILNQYISKMIPKFRTGFSGED